MPHVRLALCTLAVLVGPAAFAAEPAGFRLTFDKAALDTPFTGRVFVMLLPRQPAPLPSSLSWDNPQPTFAKDVKDWKPGEPLAIGAEPIAITPLANLKKGKYYIQAVMDRDLGGISFAASPGNVYSKAIQMDFDPKAEKPIELKLDQVYAPTPLKETANVKIVDIESPLLTKFHGKPIRMRAGVILPPSFDKEPEKKYPVVYEIPGFSGTHSMAFGVAPRKPWDVAGTEMIWVILDPSCRLGHHVFADSANNGPRGQALIEELIPEIEKRFRGIGKPGARFVTGHSSGGWSSLWLQVAYPDFFGGCWSTSPDPVDFRDFQRIDLYATEANMFKDEKGERRPIGRQPGGKAFMFYQPFSDMEVVMGRGGQLFSFEAVFSPKGEDGKPLELWDRKTGAVNSSVAKAWEKYDIRLVLERNWKTLGPKLAGKLHVYMGEEDTFYLEGATRLLKKSLEELKSDAVVELFPGKTHNLVDAKLRERMNKEMAAAFKNQQ